MTARTVIDQIRAVRDQHSIVEVLERFGTYPPSRWDGASDFMVSCPVPNHDDSTPSCIVHPQTDRYYCFGCGAHGDALQLVQDVLGRISLRGAADFLEGRSSLTPPRPRSSANVERQATVNQERTTLERVLEVNEAAWSELTTREAVGVARGYLSRRGLDLDALDRAIAGPVAGYTPSRRDGLASRLGECGFSADEIIDAGWAIRGDDGRVRDRFRRRVMFPMTSGDGVILGAVGRDITGHAQRRYINSPRTRAFDKSSVLYRPSLRSTEPSRALVVCEGPLDALAVIAHGERTSQSFAAVAVSGTALTASQARAIRNISAKRVTICADADAAGEAAARNWRRELISAAVSTSSIRLPVGADPMSWLTDATGAPHMIEI